MSVCFRFRNVVHNQAMVTNPGISKASASRPRIRAAQYLRMSTDTQTYSIHNQRDAIGEYADIMGYDIVATYEDPGRSGLNIEGRPGLQRLLMDVESGQADFETVVVYDVSRWGRFQNIDESASYEYRCQRAGVRIEFCAEQFANDGTIGSDVLKAIKRSMAAELSRMLSIKVFLGQRRVVKMGFCGGGLAGYGLRRLLVDEAGEPKFILKRRQYKGLASDRVVLVPGPPEEIAVVRWIFSQFVKGKSRIEIVRALNKRGVLTEMGRTWTSNTVHTVLNNERYIGNIVWNRKSEKLHGKRARNPASAWVRAEKSCEPILDRKVFLRARAVADARAPLSNERMLADLSKLLVERGKLSEHIINAAPGCVSVSTYQVRFGSLYAVYKLVGFDPPNNGWFHINDQLHRRRRKIIEDLLASIGLAGGLARYDPETKLVSVNDEFTVAVWIARCHPERFGCPHWAYSQERLPEADISVLIRMNPDNVSVRDYLIGPTFQVQRRTTMLTANNHAGIDAFLFQSMDPLVELARRVRLEGPALS